MSTDSESDWNKKTEHMGLALNAGIQSSADLPEGARICGLASWKSDIAIDPY